MTEEMLNTALEIEGLIRILKDGEKSAEVIALLRAKTNSLARMANEISNDSEISEQLRTTPNDSERSDGLQKSPSDSENSDNSDNFDDILLFTEEESLQTPQPELPAAKTSTSTASDLKRYFSLNDRYLYSRELFGGDMKMFDSTLRFLEGVTDFSDVEDYFYSELEWDPEDTNVASFMDILRPHFNE